MIRTCHRRYRTIVLGFAIVLGVAATGAHAQEIHYCPETLMWEWNGVYYWSVIVCDEEGNIVASEDQIGTTTRLCSTGCASECCDQFRKIENRLELKKKGITKDRPKTRRYVRDDTKRNPHYFCVREGRSAVVRAGDKYFLVREMKCKLPREYNNQGEPVGFNFRTYFVGQETDVTDTYDTGMIDDSDPDELVIKSGVLDNKVAIVLYKSE